MAPNHKPISKLWRRSTSESSAANRAEENSTVSTRESSSPSRIRAADPPSETTDLSTDKMLSYSHATASKTPSRGHDSGKTSLPRAKPSFKERFWSSSSANFFENDEDNKIKDAGNNKAAKRTPYVPTHAASDFSRLGASTASRRPALTAVAEDDRTSMKGPDGHDESTKTGEDPSRDSEPGDYALFLAQSRSEGSVRRAAQAQQEQLYQRQSENLRPNSHSRHRDSAYYSATTRSSDSARRASSTTDSSKIAAGSTLGRRISEYIKPTS